MSTDPTTRFERVYNGYLAALKPTSSKKLFINQILQPNSTLEHVQESITALIGCSNDESRIRLETYVAPVVQILNKFSPSIDQMTASYPTPSVAVWGGLRCVIESMLGYSREDFGKAAAVLASLEGHLNFLEDCNTVEALSTPFGPIVQHLVGLLYTHITDLFYDMTKEFGDESLKQPHPHSKLETSLNSIKADVGELNRTCTFAKKHLQHELGQEVTEVLEILERHIAERARSFSTSLEHPYHCLTIGVASAGRAPYRLAAASSCDKKEQTLCYVDDSSENDIRLLIEKWSLDGPKALKKDSTYSLVVTKSDCLWSRFNTSGLQSLQLVPKPSHTSLVSPVRLSLGGSVLHVGCQMFRLNGEEAHRAYSKFDVGGGGAGDSYFEESCQQGSIIVLARRRKPKAIDPSWDLDRITHGIRMRKLRDTKGGSRRSRHYNDSSEASCSDDCDEDDNDELSEDDMEAKDDTAANPSVLDYFSGTESDSDRRHDHDTSSAGTDHDDDDDDLILGETDDESEDGSELSSLLSDASDRSSAWDSLSELSSPSAAQKDKQDVKLKQSSQRVRMANFSRDEEDDIMCNACQECPDTWYYCDNCESKRNGFDLCQECVEKGYWCYDQSHDLFECEYGVVRGMISWSTALARQDLVVLDVAQDPPEQLYAWNESCLDMLHESAPCIEPRLKLVVWPVGQERLLFAQYDGGAARLHSLRTTTRKARQISIALHFSGCGRYLHAAHIEATRLPKQTMQESKGKMWRPTHDLTFVLTTLRISTDSADPTRRPEKVARHVYPLGPWEKKVVSVLPFSWTWTDREVYLCLSDSTLRVYKAPLTQRSKTNAMSITSPQNVIVLPRSAPNRTVQFFPADKQKAASKVVIGPYYDGRAPSEPVILFLKNADLGQWIDARRRDDMRAVENLKRRENGDSAAEHDNDDQIALR